MTATNDTATVDTATVEHLAYVYAWDWLGNVYVGVFVAAIAVYMLCTLILRSIGGDD